MPGWLLSFVAEVATNNIPSHITSNSYELPTLKGLTNFNSSCDSLRGTPFTRIFAIKSWISVKILLKSFHSSQLWLILVDCEKLDSMLVNSIIKENIDELVNICKKYRVSKLYAFGSVLSERFNEKSSDIDLVVELEPMKPLVKGETIMKLWGAFETLFRKKVDLLTDQPIRNPYLRKNVENTKRLIYDGKSEKVFI